MNARQSNNITECYRLAELILKPFEKETSMGVADPLAYVCLAHTVKKKS